MGQLKTQFDTKLEEAIGEYEDGKKIAGDIPAYLALGVGYSPVNAVRVNVGFHWFDDKHATSYNNRQEKLKRGTLEYNAGVEVDVNKKITLSTGWQNTNYGLSDEYMDDKSFVVSSNSVASRWCLSHQQEDGLERGLLPHLLSAQEDLRECSAHSREEHQLQLRLHT